MNSKSIIPGWFVALAVVAAAGVTVWAMLRRSGGESWLSDTALFPQRVAQVVSPAVAAFDSSKLQPVAANRPAGAQNPIIQAGALSKHADRGPCTLCHVVVDAVGNNIPMITALASLPHQYRGGLCMNCHQVKTTSQQASSTQLTAANRRLPAAGLPPMALAAPTPLPPATPAAAATPNEGSWLGMEVAPITRQTAAQFKVPSATTGVVVTEAEGLALIAGVKAGDVVVSVNAIPVSDMKGFIGATNNGALVAGTIELLRGGRLFRGQLGQAPRAQPPPAPAPAAVSPVPAALPAPQQPPAPTPAAPIVPAAGLGGGPAGPGRLGPLCPNQARQF